MKIPQKTVLSAYSCRLLSRSQNFTGLGEARPKSQAESRPIHTKILASQTIEFERTQPRELLSLLLFVALAACSRTLCDDRETIDDAPRFLVLGSGPSRSHDGRRHDVMAELH